LTVYKPQWLVRHAINARDQQSKEVLRLGPLDRTDPLPSVDEIIDEQRDQVVRPRELSLVSWDCETTTLEEGLYRADPNLAPLHLSLP
jgi:hypothetical protein